MDKIKALGIHAPWGGSWSFALTLSVVGWGAAGCSENPIADGSEIDPDTLRGDPISVSANPDNAKSMDDFADEDVNQSKSLAGEVPETTQGKIVLGKTTLVGEENQSLVIVDNLPPHDPSSPYKAVGFKIIKDFTYEIEWERDGMEFDFSAYCARVPSEVRKLSGSKVALEGFMVPTIVDENNKVKEFLLMPDQLSCCFGQAPEANGWVVVRSESGVEVTMDRVIRVLGALSVEERWDEEFFVGLYHLECDQMIDSDH